MGCVRSSDGVIYPPEGRIGYLTDFDIKVLGKTVEFLDELNHYNEVKYKKDTYLIPRYAISTKKDIINAFFAENR